jgi:hypothetical protein
MLLSSLAVASPLERLFAPKAEPWPRWQAHDETRSSTIAHDDWNAFLGAYVRKVGDGSTSVAYGEVSAADRERLGGYIERMASVPISSYRRAEQFAYWVNLYNALTVAVVLDHYPVDSIRDIDISPGLFADGPWRKSLVAVEGQELTLDDIEHRILRPIWRDPRIHYAVNCASVGCPDLQPLAFTAENTERLLDAGARAYVNHPRGIRVGDDGLTLSSIYNWFASDFERDGGVLAHVRRHATPELASALAGVDAVSNYAYDWRLNDAERER